jgi:CrcB protein
MCRIPRGLDDGFDLGYGLGAAHARRKDPSGRRIRRLDPSLRDHGDGVWDLGRPAGHEVDEAIEVGEIIALDEAIAVDDGDRAEVILALVVGIGGSLGAMSRYMVDGTIQDRSTGSLPVGTLTVNLAGSVVMGFVTGLFVFAGISHEWVAVIGTGFCGGLTTWSAASWETVRLIEERELSSAVVTALGGLVASCLMAGAGFLLAYAIGR